jgi:WD40 repeat protein
MQRFEKIRSPIGCLAWSPDGSELLATYRNGMMVGRCDTRRGTFRRWHPYIDHPASYVTFSPDGKWLAVGSNAGLVLPYDVATSSYVHEFHAGGPVRALAWAPQTRNVLAGASLGLTLWSTDPDDVAIDLAEDNVYTALAWSADESWLAAVNADQAALEVHRLNDRLTWAHEVFSTENIGKSSSLSIAPGGTRERMSLAAVSGGSVFVYTVERERGFTSRRRLEGYEREATQVAFHPGGAFLATAGDDESVRYWDVRTWRELKRYDWEIGKVGALAFAPDGMRCAAGPLWFGTLMLEPPRHVEAHDAAHRGRTSIRQ